MKNFYECCDSWKKKDFSCDFSGCIYNKDGVCFYAKAIVKIESAKACYDNLFDNCMEE